MSSDRDKLAGILREATGGYTRTPPFFQRIADAVLAAGWRPPAQLLESMKDLDAVPVGTIIRTSTGRAAVKESQYDAPDAHGNYSEWSVAEGYDGSLCGSDELDDLPAVLLWSPTEKASPTE
jgi:hypothetical protein